MFPPNPETHPSRQVERIREILIGRQMESVERRLEKLETRVPPMPTAAEGDVFMLCLEVFEKRHNLEIQEIREGIAANKDQHARDIHRLAVQIQSVAKSRSTETESGEALEHRVGTWLSNWQASFVEHLREREHFLIQEFRTELQRMRDWVTEEMTRREPPGAPPESPAMRESLTRLADAAREFAEAAALHTRPTAAADSPIPTGS